MSSLTKGPKFIDYQKLLALIPVSTAWNKQEKQLSFPQDMQGDSFTHITPQFTSACHLVSFMLWQYS